MDILDKIKEACIKQNSCETCFLFEVCANFSVDPAKWDTDAIRNAVNNSIDEFKQIDELDEDISKENLTVDEDTDDDNALSLPDKWDTESINSGFVYDKKIGEIMEKQNKIIEYLKNNV